MPIDQEFPLETPCPVPGCLSSVRFIPSPFDPEQPLLVIKQEGSRSGVDLFLTEHNLKEIVSICDGRLTNVFKPIGEGTLAMAVSDQSLAYVRDYEELLKEYVVGDGVLNDQEKLLTSLVQACVLIAIKVVRSQQ